MEVGSLIPGLPDDFVILCLVRIPRIHHARLRSVCRIWRSLVESREFYMGRQSLNLTDESIFMIPRFADPPGKLNCVEVDVKTKQTRMSVYVNHGVTEDILLQGGACISVGHLVLTLGGYRIKAQGESRKKRTRERKRASAAVNVFNTIDRSWTRGADMTYARGDFAVGLINGKLYVVGGVGDDGYVSSGEVYDPEADVWCGIAELPVALHVRCFWVSEKSRLYVTSNVHAYSYTPETDSWSKEDLSRHPSAIGMIKPIAARDESVYVGCSDERSICAYKHVKERWYKCLSWSKDKADGDNCLCWGEQLYRKLLSLKEVVVVFKHLRKGESGIKLTRCKWLEGLGWEVVSLSSPCPCAWAVSSIDA